MMSEHFQEHSCQKWQVDDEYRCRYAGKTQCGCGCNNDADDGGDSDDDSDDDDDGDDGDMLGDNLGGLMASISRSEFCRRHPRY